MPSHCSFGYIFADYQIQYVAFEYIHMQNILNKQERIKIDGKNISHHFKVQTDHCIYLHMIYSK